VRLSAARARNGTRQFVCCPNHVPLGTPRRAAVELPAYSMEIARPRTAGTNSPAAAGVTTAQKTAWLSAVTMRPVSSVA
jgi:hypothetical protein